MSRLDADLARREKDYASLEQKYHGKTETLGRLEAEFSQIDEELIREQANLKRSKVRGDQFEREFKRVQADMTGAQHNLSQARQKALEQERSSQAGISKLKAEHEGVVSAQSERHQRAVEKLNRQLTKAREKTELHAREQETSISHIQSQHAGQFEAQADRHRSALKGKETDLEREIQKLRDTHTRTSRATLEKYQRSETEALQRQKAGGQPELERLRAESQQLGFTKTQLSESKEKITGLESRIARSGMEVTARERQQQSDFERQLRESKQTMGREHEDAVRRLTEEASDRQRHIEQELRSTNI